MIEVQSSKLKVKSYISKFKVTKLINFGLIIATLHFVFCALRSPAYAVSPTVPPKLTPTPTKKLSATPLASPSASLTPASPSTSRGGPTGTEDEKVSEIRQAIKDKLNQIKDNIEKKAYVGVIFEITDSTLTLTNFRGKQRVRLFEDTIIVGAGKKEIAAKDLAVGDKVIALGEPDNNEILKAKRVIFITAPKTVPAKRVIFFGAVTAVNSKTAVLTLAQAKNPDQTLQIKIDKTTYLVNPKDPKTEIALKNFVAGQKLIVIYLEPAEAKTPLAKTIFLLP